MAVELILIPLVSAILAAVIRDEKLTSKLSTIAISILPIYLISTLLLREPPFVDLFIQITVHGHIEYAFTLGINALNVVPLIAVTTLLPAIYVYSYEYVKHRVKELTGVTINLYYVLMLVNSASILGVLLAHNIITFILFYEFLVLTSWAIIYFYGYGERVKISLTYLVWSLVGSLFILVGLASIYAFVGSFDFSGFKYGYQLPAWIFYILLVGFCIKMGVAGLHLWLPPAHSEAPTPFSAVLSPIIIGLGGYGILRFVKPFFNDYIHSLILMFWGLISIVYGGLSALSENDVKRILAYSSISQMGYMLISLAPHELTLATIAFSYHYLAHAYAKALLFLSSGTLIYALNVRDIRAVRGLMSTYKSVSVAFMAGFLSLAGLPPFSGFNSKLIIASALLKSTIETELYIIALLALSSTIITLAYGVRVIRRLVFGPPTNVVAIELPRSMSLGLILILALMVITWLIPHTVLVPISIALD